MTTTLRIRPEPDLRGLTADWMLALAAEGKAPGTRRSYLIGATQYLDWLDANDQPSRLTRRAVQAWTVDMLGHGLEPTTVRARVLAARRFSAWLAVEGELAEDPLLGLKPVRLNSKPVSALTDDQVHALLAPFARRGRRDFKASRDEAILRLMLDTGLRADELVSLDTTDIDVTARLAVVRKGKGGKGRVVRYGPKTANAVGRYLRRRSEHRCADMRRSRDAEGCVLWLSHMPQPMSYAGIYDMITRRMRDAGIDGHPHMLRHTFAVRWRRAGGSDGGLMTAAGWTSRAMIDRYTKAEAADLYAAEFDTLGLDSDL